MTRLFFERRFSLLSRAEPAPQDCPDWILEHIMISKKTIAAAALAVAWIAQPAYSATKKKQLGSVHFETSCKPDAQRLFDTGMLYQHSFWYGAARRTFEEVLKADPQCAIAYWGIAVSYLNNPHNPPPSANLPLGLA